MALLIVGIIFAGIGLGLWYAKGKKEGKSATLATTDTSQVSEVNELYESMRNSMGDGSFTHFVELKGVAHTDSPITSELSDEQVVYYSSKVVKEYEKQETKKDSNGNTKKVWNKKTETVSQNKKWANGFGVKDDTGFIEIDPSKAELHTEQLRSEYESEDQAQNSAFTLKLGGVSLGLGTKTPGIRNVGFRYIEEGIRINTRLYVLGDANDRDGSLIVSDPKEKSQPFIVSTKSEDEILTDLGSSANGLKWGAFVCWGLGVGLAIAGVLKMINVF